jgi:hypothetical protein
MLKVGRHFRIGSRSKVLIGRNETENDLLEAQALAGEYAFRWRDGSSPTGLITGKVDDELLQTAAKILLRYTKAEQGHECILRSVDDGEERNFTAVHDFVEADIERLRV